MVNSGPNNPNSVRWITAKNALVKILRLSQIASGFVTVDPEDGEAKGAIEIIGHEKSDLLKEVLEDLPEDEPVVVFCRFTPSLAQVHEVAKKLKRGSLELSGQHHDLEKWQDGAAPILAVQLQSGGAGIDLTRAHYGVYFERDFNLATYDQSRARLHRPGQTASVSFIHLVAQGTIDEVIVEALENRRDVVEAALDELKHRKKGG